MERKSHGIDLFRGNGETNLPSESDNLLKDSHLAKEKIDTLSPEQKSWISEETCHISKLKSRALRQHNQAEIEQLGEELR